MLHTKQWQQFATNHPMREHMPANKIAIISAKEDDRWLKRLLSHLNPIANSYNLEIWHTQMLIAGNLIDQDIQQNVNDACLAILLVSGHFFTDNIIARWTPYFLKRCNDNGLRLYPIILSPCTTPDWIRARATRPAYGNPLSKYNQNKINETLADAARELVQIASEKSHIQKEVEKSRAEQRRTAKRTEAQLVEHSATLRSLQKGLARLRIKSKRDRAEISINVDDLGVDVYNCGSGSERRHVLETRIALKNNGDQSACIVAAYAFARTLVDRNALTDGAARVYKNDLYELPRCDELSEPRNLARIENSIVQLAPGEVEHFIRWDSFGSKFVEDYPVIVIGVEIFGAPYDLLGFGNFPKPFEGRLRKDWLSYMNGESRQDKRRHETIVFSRAREASTSHNVGVGDRIILDPDTTQPDFGACTQFRDILKGMFQWSRQKTVPLIRHMTNATPDAPRTA
ncbi:MAG: hypothetical protein U0359_04455 [Byssovorax sp.]